MFGRKDRHKEESLEQWRDGLEAEVERLDSLSLATLGAEVIIAAVEAGAAEDDVTVGGGNIRTAPSAYRIASKLMEAKEIDFPSPMKDRELQERLVRLVAEGLQELEHASLIRVQHHDPPGAGLDYVITRRGRAAFDRGEVANILSALSA
jgi:hypothetical protein